MTEKPIIFSGPMVRAILEDRKTQTRRIVKKAPWLSDQIMNVPGTPYWTDGSGWDSCVKCPYGEPGGRLWVREAWQEVDWPPTGPRVVYRADGDASPYRWRPSIHMPRWASRITLEVESVRVERLQAIRAEDAWWEGIGYQGGIGRSVFIFKDGRTEIDEAGCVDAFRYLWQSIHAPGSWAANPFVWVVGFKRITP
jgi:hypothetical protein